ncbi:unnamed protein product [Paramecium octaurelia]|uniref:Protein kinase domain-containing protein n=1 Tax=Paramecium octaurelia TaxID=43137 RepID=A0A8S1WII0_PAROT|nr:unnamed protein product [Paramecium octaurelia]
MDIKEQYAQYTQKNYTANVFKVGDHNFILDKRYNPTNQLGSGAYGVVLQADDLKAPPEGPKKVAIKKIEKTFQHRFYAKRTLRELKILRNLKHENIVNLITIALPKSRVSMNDIYLVTELLDTDLRKVLEREHAKLTEDHYKLFLYQILRGIKYMHSANILHRDLKPRNILLNKEDCMLKVCDFGLSRALLSQGLNGQNPNVMTDYVETRYYRAPELLLGLKQYTKAVDMWSVGCIFAEIVRGKALWRGASAESQLKLIFETMGTPNKQEIKNYKDPFFQQKMLEAVVHLGQFQKVPLDKIIKGISPQGYDLLERLLDIDFTKRITADEALAHPYFEDLHSPEDEPYRQPVSDKEFEFELYELTTEQLKDMVYEEILLYHFPDFRKEYERKIAENESVIKHILTGQSARLIDPLADDDFPDFQ